MREIIIHQVNISHYRLVELSKLADQAKPFYDWIERHAKAVTGSHRSLNEIILNCPRRSLKQIISACYLDDNQEKPLLFDGIGRVYSHAKACFYFFAWIIRDAPQQRLAPLIVRMQKADNINRLIAETDSLTELIYQYRAIAKNFEWPAVREIVLDRLEGSRRSISGHHLETSIRTGLITAIQNYFSIYNNYGFFNRVEIADKQIKIGRHTIDVSASLFRRDSGEVTQLLIPVKTRETEGGGHSHIFTRDIISAITDLREENPNIHIAAIIIAQNWSHTELKAISDKIDIVFHFNMPPNKFGGFDEDSQIRLNRYIESIFKKGKLHERRNNK